MPDYMHSDGCGNCVFLLIQSTPRKGTNHSQQRIFTHLKLDTIYTP